MLARARHGDVKEPLLLLFFSNSFFFVEINRGQI